MALVEEIHLRAKCRAGLFVVKLGEERIVLSVVDAARVQLLGQRPRESRFSHADGPFDDDVARGLEGRARSWRAIISNRRALHALPAARDHRGHDAPIEQASTSRVSITSAGECE